METQKEQSKQAKEPAKSPQYRIRVLEWAQFVAGPYCAKLLADLGAEVIKIEDPGSGDEARRRGPFPKDVPHPERSALFLYLNTNKKGITLNLHTETGKNVFRKLLGEVDILIEDKPPRLMEELGLNYENLKRINPRLIMTSITPFGQNGPYRDYKAYHLNTFNGSGFGYLTPTDRREREGMDRRPLLFGEFLADYYAAVNAGTATLAALYARAMRGMGQHIDVSKQETPAGMIRSDIAEYLLYGEIARRTSSVGRATWGGTIPCKDGYVSVIGTQGRQVQGIFDLMGNPEWSKDEKFKPEVFHQHSLEIRPYVWAWMAEHRKEDIWHGGQQRGAPLAPVYTVEEAASADHLKAREFFVEMEHSEAGKLRYPGVPYKFSRTAAQFRYAAPLLGEHNEEIYCGWLGYSRQDLVRMRGTGTI